MKNRERVQRRINEIKAMTNPLDAIKELADLTMELGEDACAERQAIQELTRQNRVILMGNGKQEDSIIYKLGETIKSQVVMMETLTSIQKHLIGDIKDPEASSLASRLRDVERVIDNINKLTWIVIGVFVTQLALFVWAFFIH